MRGLRRIGSNERLDSILAEKIMLAVVGVNQCECCSYNHTVLALERGIAQPDIEALLSGDTENLTDGEIPAILFAQHWADTKGDVTQTVRQKVVAFYGEHKAEHMEALIRLSEFTSLCNNTVTVYRCTDGKKRIRFFLAYLGCLPFHALMMRRYNQNKNAYK